MKLLIVGVAIISVLLFMQVRELLIAVWHLFGGVSMLLWPLLTNLWETTPDTLRPLWGVMTCIVVLLMFFSSLIFHMLNRIRRWR